MSSYGVIYLEKLNTDTKEWDLYTLYDYRKNYQSQEYEYFPILLEEEQGHLRDLLRDSEILGDYSQNVVINQPNHSFNLGKYLTDYLGKTYDFGKEPSDGRIFGSYIEPKWMSLGQLLVYLQHEPEVDSYAESYDESTDSWKCEKIENPLFDVVRKIYWIMDAKRDYDFSHASLNELRIVYWVDY